jgi:hypothetical protein
MVSGDGVMCAAAAAVAVDAARLVVDPSMIRKAPEGASESVDPETVIGAPPGERVCPEMTNTGPGSSWISISCACGLPGGPSLLAGVEPGLLLEGRAVNVVPPRTSSGCAFTTRGDTASGVSNVCVELPITTKAAEDSRLTLIPSKTAVPPGVRV